MQSKITKKFGEFVKEKKFRKILSRLVIEGQVGAKYFFGKKRKFELHIFYTSVKKTILEIEIEGVDYKDINAEFKIGDHISKVYEWVEKNGHTILYNFEK
jgi:hypothetical protein